MKNPLSILPDYDKHYYRPTKTTQMITMTDIITANATTGVFVILTAAAL